MYIPSSKKDVVLTVIICTLTIALAVIWHSHQIANGELEIAKYKLASCEEDLKKAKEKNQVLRDSSIKSVELAENTIPILERHKAVTDMICRRIKNGEISEPIIREYLQIVKQ
jgi:hypothetical protein